MRGRTWRALPGWICAVAGLGLLSIPAGYARGRSNDEQALMRLEHEWMNASDAAGLDRILASDFVHIGVRGTVEDKAEMLKRHAVALPPGTAGQRLEDVRVLIFGNTGIVNGRDVGMRADGSTAWQDRFTDVFVRHRGEWRAVNAQETLIPSR